MSRFKLCRSFVLVVGLWVVPSISEAVCSGLGTTTITCPSGESSANVQTAINGAPDGATITFSAGTYNWTSTGSLQIPIFSPARSLTLACVSVGGCTMSMGGGGFVAYQNCSGDHNKLFRITGFVFNGGSSNIVLLNAYDNTPTQTCTMRQFRVDHNTFQNQTQSARIFALSAESRAFIYGVIDHNTITATNNSGIGEYYGLSLVNGPTGARGAATNLFLEDNVVNYGTQSVDTITCFDTTGEPAMVFRFNTMTNCRIAFHGSTSSGSRNIEIYGNRINLTSGLQTDGYRAIAHQGSGEILIWKNEINPTGTINESALQVTHYRSATPSDGGYNNPPGQCEGTNSLDGNRAPTSTNAGYPCWHQPGRDTAGVLQPMYAWGNVDVDTGNKVDLEVTAVHSTAATNFPKQFKADRDYFNAVSVNAQTSSSSPFNGTTGMGFGTLANRPTTCSIGLTQAADTDHGGVGYWCTDCGSWNAQANEQGVQFGGSDGVLYRCGTANTWTAHYTPYPYPHPLVGGSTPDTTPPAAPTGVTISQVVR